MMIIFMCTMHTLFYINVLVQNFKWKTCSNNLIWTSWFFFTWLFFAYLIMYALGAAISKPTKMQGNDPKNLFLFLTTLWNELSSSQNSFMIYNLIKCIQWIFLYINVLNF